MSVARFTFVVGMPAVCVAAINLYHPEASTSYARLEPEGRHIQLADPPQSLPANDSQCCRRICETTMPASQPQFLAIGRMPTLAAIPFAIPLSGIARRSDSCERFLVYGIDAWLTGLGSDA